MEGRLLLRMLFVCWSRALFSIISMSRLRLVKVSLGGQTVTLGKGISSIEKVFKVVETGLDAHSAKDWWMRYPATVKPVMTTNIQNNLLSFCVLAR